MADIFFWPNNGSNLNVLRLNDIDKTVDGINFKYNSSTGIITLNGTRNTASERISFLSTYCYLPNDQKISISSTYLGGSISNGRFVLELPPVLDGTGHNGGDRFNLDMFNSSIKKQGLTLKPGNSYSAELWAWPNGGDVTFNNYQVKIKVEHSTVATPWSPNPKESSPGSTYGKLITSLTRDKYKFDGWYNMADDSLITSSSIQSSGNINLYAKWISLERTINVNLDKGYWEKDSTIKILEGEQTNFPPPKKDGYIFGGWAWTTQGTMS